VIGKEEYSQINALLNQKLDKYGVLIAVHRGSSGGNIIENTLPAMKAAIQRKGDIVEIDVSKSTDGVFYVFHDGAEMRLLDESVNIKSMDSGKIESLRYINGIGEKTKYKVERLVDVLSYIKGNVLVNLDRSWDYWPDLLPVLDKEDMLNQILLKSPVKDKVLKVLNEHENKYMYMPIIHTEEDIDRVLEYQNINVVGMELIADSMSHPLYKDEIILELINRNLFVWANAINLNDEIHLFAEFDDNTSIIECPDKGWGELIEKQIGVIQTDWPDLLAEYRNQKIKKNK
jgi:glycerophosphoryl diester phosphodiesterase